MVVYFCVNKNYIFIYKVRSHGLVVKANDSSSRGCEFEPRHRILDGWKLLQTNDNNRNKGSQMGHSKKKL